MITRREIVSTLAVILAGLVSKSSKAFAGAKATTGAANQAPPTGQNPSGHDMSSIAVETLMEEPLAAMTNPEVKVITLTVAPGGVSGPHQHTGPVFAYLLEGEIENQVDPNAPRRYKPGDHFYEPPLHVHRLLRNLSATQPAKLLIFEVEEKGKQFTIPAK